MRRVMGGLVLLGLVSVGQADDAARVEKNVIYGMYSGLALLMDVHHPAKPNGYGVVFISGSAWQAPTTYGATPLKEQQIGIWGPPLLRAGYTVFAINHRAAPRFHYPAAVEDVQRAVRFVRHHAAEYGIDGSRLGGVGGSSGGHLIGLVALLAAPGIPDDADAVNREPATVQAVVLRAAPGDLRTVGSASGIVASFMERVPDQTPEDRLVYAAASPITHVSKSSPPVLLMHGDADDVVPYQQSVAMEAALKAAGVDVKLLTIAGGKHGPDFAPRGGPPHPQLPLAFSEAVGWLDSHLRSGAAKP
jgi:acetyl esterase/lipase